MNAQIVSADFRGKHNADLESSARRILESGSWKKQRTVVVMPAANQIPTKVALSMWNLAFPPNQGVHRMVALGHEVGDAYSNCITEILNSTLADWEYILTVEHDNMPPPDGLVKLIADMEKHPEYSAIGGLYWTKGDAGVPQIWGDPKDAQLNYRPQVPIPNTVQECCGVAQGFTLFRLAMFRDTRLKRPWFRTLNGMDGQGVGTQDLVFWSDARKYGYRCAIDTSVLVGHYDFAGSFGPADTVW